MSLSWNICSNYKNELFISLQRNGNISSGAGRSRHFSQTIRDYLKVEIVEQDVDPELELEKVLKLGKDFHKTSLGSSLICHGKEIQPASLLDRLAFFLNQVKRSGNMSQVFKEGGIDEVDAREDWV